jgi:hypothetical protein
MDDATEYPIFRSQTKKSTYVGKSSISSSTFPVRLKWMTKLGIYMFSELSYRKEILSVRNENLL